MEQAPVATAHTNIRIEPAQPHRRAGALMRVFADLDDADRRAQVDALLASPGAAQSLAGLFEARSDDLSAGAVWVTVQPGRAAMIWPPRLADGQPADLARRLLDVALALAGEAEARLIQALLPTDAGSDARLLTSAGFRHPADLLYLVSTPEHFPQSQPVTRLQFEPVARSQFERLGRLVLATYEETLDCPSLNGLREIEDVLDGYRATGTFHEQRWLFAQQTRPDLPAAQPCDVGCLLLTEHQPASHWELMYMGLVPAVRGQGHGLELVRYAQWLAGRAGCQRLVLAVDANNAPAITAYAAAGFAAWDRRSVFLKLLPS